MSLKRIIAGGVTKPSSTALFASSTNGSAWTTIGKDKLTGGVNWIETKAIKYWANRWVAVGNGTMNNGATQMPIITSSIGDDWQAATITITVNGTYTAEAVDYSGTVWLVSGRVYFNGTNMPFLYKSTNGINWDVVFNPADNLYIGDLKDLQWVNNSWFIVGTRYYIPDDRVPPEYIYKSSNYDASNIKPFTWDKTRGEPNIVTNYKGSIYAASSSPGSSWRLNRFYITLWSSVSHPLSNIITDSSIYRNGNSDERIVICGQTNNNGLGIAWSTNGTSFAQPKPKSLYNNRINCLSKFFGINILAGTSDGRILYSTDKAENWAINNDQDLQNNFLTFNNIEVAFN